MRALLCQFTLQKKRSLFPALFAIRLHCSSVAEYVPEHLAEIIEFLAEVLFSFFCGTIEFGFSRYLNLQVAILQQVIQECVHPCLRDKDIIPVMDLMDYVIP